MIEISCQNIEFFSDERIKTFQVTNKGQVGLLFKVYIPIFKDQNQQN